MMNKKIAFLLLGALALSACDDVEPKDGVDGLPGDDGASSLVLIAPEPAGDHCAHGGQRVITGVDRDGDGALGEAEIGETAYVCNGEAGAPGAIPLLRVVEIHAIDRCERAGLQIDVGFDQDGDGELSDDEIDPARRIYLCEPTPPWKAGRSLPAVETAYSFSLAANTTDGRAHLGFFFLDADYQAELEGALWDGGGVYSGAFTYVTYRLDSAGEWVPYEGRKTPQFYEHSELLVFNDESFYTTQFPAFGGLLSVIKNGGEGAYAPTAAFTGERAHSLSFMGGDDEHIYFAIAQNDAGVFGAGNQGLVLARLPADDGSFVTWPPAWQLITTLEPLEVAQDDVSEIRLNNAGDALVASYLVAGVAKFYATRDLEGIDSAVAGNGEPELREIARCADAILADAAFDGELLYIACVDAGGDLEIRRAAIDDLTAEPAWEIVPTRIGGAIDAIDLEASAERGVSIALRQGERLRVYTWLSGDPSFDEALVGDFDHAHSAAGVILSVCDQEGDGIVRTFIY